jgi:hypothetical protein
MDNDKLNISFKDVSEPHEKLIKNFEIPEWVSNQKCPKCNKKIGLLSLRTIGLKLNAKHIGNFFVDACCQYCNYGYELHLKNSCQSMNEFILLLKDGNYEARLSKMEPDYLIPNDENNLVKSIIQKENYGNKKTQ